MAKSSSEWKCESIKANLAGGLSGILTYVSHSRARRPCVEPPNFDTEDLMP